MSDLRQVAGIVLAVAVLPIACAALVRMPFRSVQSGTGFGPEWVCAPQAKGDPVCWTRR